jgi:hypothetical protein
VRHMCQHCEVPTCVSVCPVGALSKLEEGPVLYDGYKWAAPQFPGPPGGGNQWKAIMQPSRLCRRRAAAQQSAIKGDQSHAAAHGRSGPCGERVAVSSPWPRLWNGC